MRKLYYLVMISVASILTACENRSEEWDVVDFGNDYTNFKIYINKNELFNFQMKLRNMVMDNDIPDEGGIDPNTIANAAVIVAILPFAIIYPFCQKYFVQGVNVGAVKE